MNEMIDPILVEYEVEFDRYEHHLLALLPKFADNGLIDIKHETAVSVEKVDR